MGGGGAFRVGGGKCGRAVKFYMWCAMALFGAGSSFRVGWRAAELVSGFQGFAASIGRSFILEVICIYNVSK